MDKLVEALEFIAGLLILGAGLVMLCLSPDVNEVILETAEVLAGIAKDVVKAANLIAVPGELFEISFPLLQGKLKGLHEHLCHLGNHCRAIAQGSKFDISNRGISNSDVFSKGIGGMGGALAVAVGGKSIMVGKKKSFAKSTAKAIPKGHMHGLCAPRNQLHFLAPLDFNLHPPCHGKVGFPATVGPYLLSTNQQAVGFFINE
ncbi:hypothetical protein OBBRIDRAFT_807108 [Obba rivulosa]|uniref:Uncharacterized protein n=1 Tax=Obba rivulosa TaxID=1052685 RepID=A0A8E2AK07_9APHY|nr:hypothetical protein OBBRIDRAFT_807108 [Obba rivulosa]